MEQDENGVIIVEGIDKTEEVPLFSYFARMR